MSLTISRASGVYAIENHVDGKVYIGSAVDISARRRQHWSQLSRGTHPNKHLLAAWRIYGPDAFTFTVLETTSVETLLQREQFHIDARAAVGPSGYNLNPIAGSNLGRKYSDEVRRRMSEGCRKRPPVSAETCARQSAAHLGVKRGAEFGAKMTAIQKGRAVSAEQRAAISATLTGRTLTPEHRAKISAGGTGKRMSCAFVEKLIARNRGRVVSAESRAKTAASLRGRKMSAEACAKMSKSQRRRWAALRAEAAA